MTKTTQERLAEVRDKINPFFRKNKGYTWIDVHVAVSCSVNGWWASVDAKTIHNGYFGSMDEALNALEAHANRMSSADDALARTLGIAS